MDSGLACNPLPFPPFAAAVIFGDGGASWDLETADFNQDGIDDVVQLQYQTISSTQIYYVLGNGGVKQGPIFPGFGVSLAVADLNSDGWPDLVIASARFVGAGAGLDIEMNQCDGTFTGYRRPYGGSAIDVADFDGDGRLDLATCGMYGIDLFDDGSIVADAGGAPEFSAAVYLTDAGCWDMIAARFTEGGPAGLAFVSGQADSPVFVILGRGDGTFLPPATYPLSGRGNSIRAADFNGDGLVDLAVGSLSSGIAVFLNVDGGIFGPGATTPVPSGANVTRIAVADVNGDGYPDILAGDYSFCTSAGPDVLVFLNDCEGRFPSVVALDAGLQGTRAVAVLRAAGGNLPGIVAGGNCSGNLAMFNSQSP